MATNFYITTAEEQRLGLMLSHFLPIDQPLVTTNPAGKTGLQILGGGKEDAHSHALKGGDATHPERTPRIRFMTKKAPRTTMDTK